MKADFIWSVASCGIARSACLRPTTSTLYWKAMRSNWCAFSMRRGFRSTFPFLPRFGTAMIYIGELGEAGSMVELVSARAESYQPDSRKPDVRQGTLKTMPFAATSP